MAVVANYKRPSHEMTILSDVRGTAPPEKVLQVSVVGRSVFLTIATFDETNDITTTKRLAEIEVDGDTLQNVIAVAHLDSDANAKEKALVQAGVIPSA